MPRLIVLVGPPGSGKTTMAKELEQTGFCRINQDLQGKEYTRIFHQAIIDKRDIVVDRMNFNKEQRDKFLFGWTDYETEIRVLHESYETCYKRCQKRDNHQTVKTDEDARKALDFFFKNYERVSDDEADKVTRIWPSHGKHSAVICDLDGTLCNIDHRLKWMKKEKKHWPQFFMGIKDDKVNEWCADILKHMNDDGLHIVYCSGRGEEYRHPTAKWLNVRRLPGGPLMMRLAGDFRKDDVVKEIILDFEILTRYTPYFFIDDRPSVCRMWRRRGFVCLQCQDKEF